MVFVCVRDNGDSITLIEICVSDQMYARGSNDCHLNAVGWIRKYERLVRELDFTKKENLSQVQILNFWYPY